MTDNPYEPPRSNEAEPSQRAETEPSHKMNPVVPVGLLLVAVLTSLFRTETGAAIFLFVLSTGIPVVYIGRRLW